MIDNRRVVFSHLPPDTLLCIKALLEELQVEFRSLGSTTLERRSDMKAIEPGQCFYLKNEKTMRESRSVNLRMDPIPDLVLEIDTETQSHLDIYAALGIHEFWHYDKTELVIYKLRAGRYQTVEESDIFPELPVKDLLPYCLEQSRTLGRNVVMRDFRQWVRDTRQRQSQSVNS